MNAHAADAAAVNLSFYKKKEMKTKERESLKLFSNNSFSFVFISLFEKERSERSKERKEKKQLIVHKKIRSSTIVSFHLSFV